MKIINIKEIVEKRGSLAVVEDSELPFKIKRVFWIYNIDNSIERGGHAHYKTTQLILAINGNCKIILDNGKKREEIMLDNKTKGLLVEPSYWHIMTDFSKEYYDPNDYIRDYKKFKEVYK
jgi:hypothetical protein